MNLAQLLILVSCSLLLLGAGPSEAGPRRKGSKTKSKAEPKALTNIGGREDTEAAGNACFQRDAVNFRIGFSALGYMTTDEIARHYGYPAEVHDVISKDGYILRLHRIPHGKPGKDLKGPDTFPVEQATPGTRPVAFLMHGMSGASTSWVFQPEDHDIAFMLANAGYDVWMGNARGNFYSKRHVRMSSTEKRFWEWTFDEMALYDVPAVLDYILTTSGEPKLYWIGHSMGGTLFFMAMSIYPELNSKIRSFYGFGPAGYLLELKAPVLLLAPLEPVLEFAYNLIGWGELAPPVIVPLVNALGPIFCAPAATASTLCAFFIYLIGGTDPCQFNATESISMMSGNGLSIISIRCLRHYIQMVYKRRFCAFDHGATENMRRYGQPTAPDYHLSKVTAPVAIFWGENDWLVTPAGTARTVSELPNVIANHRVNWDAWSHIDFIMGIDAKALLYDHVLKLMAKYY